MKITLNTPYNLIIVPLLIASTLSLFIYAEHFDLTCKFVNTIAALGGLYGLLYAPKKFLPISGFWIGLFWFYWIGYSFQYYDLAWAQIPVALGFGLVYALYFGVLGLTSQPILRGLLLFGLTYIWPMDFNWMQLEVIFVESYLGFSKLDFALILLALALLKYLDGWKKSITLLLLLPALQLETPIPQLPNLKIKLVSTELSQDFKWQSESQHEIIQDNIAAIIEAADHHYDLIVLPESAFSLYMNHNQELMDTLTTLSYQIPILTGTLHEENGLHYNVSYLFDHGKITVAKKMILVPFGEYIPLPSFLREWVNKTVFEGGLDFVTADKPTDFMIKGIQFRNAICYEGTREELYTPDARYLIVMSNNGWFKPSIEPTLQHLLMKLYARKNGSVVFHSANGGGSGIVY